MRYVWDSDAGKWAVPKPCPRPPGPYIMGDLPAYRSPLGTGMVEGRAARREDMRRSGCREVDPSERGEYGPKSTAQLKEEKAYLKTRENDPRVDPRTVERLKKAG